MSIPPGLKNGGGKLAAGGTIGGSALGVVVYFLIQHASAIDENKYEVLRVGDRQATYAADSRELKREMQRVRENQVLICQKLEIAGCRGR